MDYTPQQDTAKKAAKAMKKSGKLTIAVGGVILGALLLFFGNRSVRGKDDAATDDPPSISSTQNVEAYRMELEARITELETNLAQTQEELARVTRERDALKAENEQLRAELEKRSHEE